MEPTGDVCSVYTSLTPGAGAGIYFGRQTLESAAGIFLTLNPGIPGGPGGPGGHRAGHCKEQKHALVYQVLAAHPGKLVIFYWGEVERSCGVWL